MEIGKKLSGKKSKLYVLICPFEGVIISQKPQVVISLNMTKKYHRGVTLVDKSKLSGNHFTTRR